MLLIDLAEVVVRELVTSSKSDRKLHRSRHPPIASRSMVEMPTSSGPPQSRGPLATSDVFDDREVRPWYWLVQVRDTALGRSAWPPLEA